MDYIVKMSCGSDVSCNILDFPDEILMKIISYLNARERAALSKMCDNLSGLIFNEPKSYGDLNFSEEGYLTSVSDVEKYFKDETKLKYIHRVNISNVYWEKPGRILNSISKATNLFEVNISGHTFEGFKEFGQFLKPLKQLRKLTCDWPAGDRREKLWNKYLKETFGRLTYLSVTICDTLDKWSLIYALELCVEVEELYLLQSYQFPESRRGCFWMKTPEPLENLRKVVSCGCDTDILYPIILDMLSDAMEWTKLYPHYDSTKTSFFYLEKNLEVAEELSYNVIQRYDMWNKNEIMGWYLRHEILLEEVALAREGKDAKDSCFFQEIFFRCYLCSMRLEDAKILLKNPRSQIPYLSLEHDIEPDCDILRIALTFPTLTKLVLTNVLKYEDLTLEEPPVKTGKKRKHSASEERNESACTNPAFKSFVDKTPLIEDLTLLARSVQGYEKWDLGALYLITSWKHLKILYLANLPITDGKFLIEIAKQCTNLEKLRLESLGPRHACCYKEGLLKMLGHCHKLKDFSIQQENFDQAADLFDALAGNNKLRRVRVESLGKKRSVGKLLQPIEKLIRSCNLMLLVCEIKGMTQFACDKLNATLQRLKDELNRPLFQFNILRWHGAKEPTRNLCLDFAHRDLILSQRFNDAMYRLGFS